MRRAYPLPIITFQGLRGFVDVRLGELRKVDAHDLTPLTFEEFDQQATDKDRADLVGAILRYYHSLKEPQ